MAEQVEKAARLPEQVTVKEAKEWVGIAQRGTNKAGTPLTGLQRLVLADIGVKTLESHGEQPDKKVIAWIRDLERKTYGELRQLTKGV